jgi:hypothetical protein
MENRSTQYGDIKNWVEKVIISCETYQQTFGAKQLIWNFEKQLQRKYPEKYWREHFYNLISPLESLLSHKRDQLSKKEFKS